MPTVHITTEGGVIITTEAGDQIITESSSAAAVTKGKRPKLKPSTFWQKYWYFYGRKAKHGKRR